MVYDQLAFIPFICAQTSTFPLNQETQPINQIEPQTNYSTSYDIQAFLFPNCLGVLSTMYGQFYFVGYALYNHITYPLFIYQDQYVIIY